MFCLETFTRRERTFALMRKLWQSLTREYEQMGRSWDLEVAAMTSGVLRGIHLKRRCETLPWGQKPGVLAARAEGMSGSLEDTTMSWFKPLNLSLIMRSPPIQMSESILGKEGFFPCLQQYLGHCLLLCVGSACARLTLR